jgi:hypothetical protein
MVRERGKPRFVSLVMTRFDPFPISGGRNLTNSVNEVEIERLVAEIENVDFREFWWDSNLLRRASQVQDGRVVSALVLRHQCLSNKKAFSAHVIREAIKAIDGPGFALRSLLKGLTTRFTYLGPQHMSWVRSAVRAF